MHHLKGYAARPGEMKDPSISMPVLADKKSRLVLFLLPLIDLKASFFIRTLSHTAKNDLDRKRAVRDRRPCSLFTNHPNGSRTRLHDLKSRCSHPEGMRFLFRSDRPPGVLVFEHQVRCACFVPTGNFVGGDFITNLDQLSILAEIPDWDRKGASQLHAVYRHPLRPG